MSWVAKAWSVGDLSPITPLLKQLLCLPVECHITSKLMVLVYKCVHGIDIPQEANPTKKNQPSNLELHHLIPKKGIGASAFDFVGPDRWNNSKDEYAHQPRWRIINRH